LQARISEFNQLPLTVAAQACLNSSGGQTTAVNNALRAVPEFLTGIAAASRLAATPANIINTTNFNNTINSLSTQANLIYGTGSKTLVNVLTRVKNFTDTSYSLYESFTTQANIDLADFGFTVTNYQDLLTGGITSQFSGQSAVGGQQFKDLARQLSNFGSMFDIRNLQSITKAHVLCTNLLVQGFSIIGDVLIRNGINFSTIDSVDNKIIVASLQQIKGKDLDNIIAVTNFKSYQTLTSLADVFDATKLFSPSALHAAGGSLAALQNKFINIGGDFDSFKELGDFLLSLDNSINLQQFNNLTNTQIATMFNSTKSSLGSGTGTYSNPKVIDVIGVLIGSNYVNLINTINASQTSILSTTLGQNLLSAIIAAQTLELNDPNGTAAAAAITTANNNLISSTNAIIAAALSNGTQAFGQLFNTFVREKINFSLVDINQDDLDFSIDTVYSFANSLETAHADSRNLGYAEFLKSLADNTIYGQAIKASIIQGFNLELLRQQNIATPTAL
jgi:hypothetical protein